MNTIRINDINDERVQHYTKYNEPQLMHINEPGPGIFIAETPMVIERAMDFGARPVSFFVEEEKFETEAVGKVFERLGDESGAEVYVAEHAVLKAVTGYNLTRGMLAAFERPAPLCAQEILKRVSCAAVLEDVVNPTNLGAIFRSAAALGVDAVLLTRGCTDPLYRRAARVSMGTVFQVPWAYLPKEKNAALTLREAGFTVISMALSERAVPITNPVLTENTKRAIVFGTEGTGLTEQTLMNSDHIAVIPMFNGVDSLNVAASSAVAFWELCGKHKKQS